MSIRVVLCCAVSLSALGIRVSDEVEAEWAPPGAGGMGDHEVGDPDGRYREEPEGVHHEGGGMGDHEVRDPDGLYREDQGKHPDGDTGSVPVIPVIPVLHEAPGEQSEGLSAQSSGPGALSAYTCTFANITDGTKCGQEQVEDMFRCGWRECTIFGRPTHCPNVCMVNNTCEVEALCKFRLRVSMSGHVDTSTYNDLSVHFAYESHEVTQGPSIVTQLLNAIGNDDAIQVMIADAVRSQQAKVQEKVDEFKVDFKQMLAQTLGRDEIFGDFAFVQGLLGNSTELVERLVSLARMRAETLAGTAAGETNSLAVSTELPEAKLWAQVRMCSHVVHELPWTLRFLPFGFLAALTALKFPRGGVVMAVVGAILATRTVVAPMCEGVAPKVLGNGNFEMTSRTPPEIQEMGAPATISFHTSFLQNGDLRAEFEHLPEPMLQEVLRQLAIRVGDAGGTLPVKVMDAHFELKGEGPRIDLLPGTWGDLDAVLDASCAPNCRGCGIIAC